ncbi:protein kilB [Streptomyces sp. NPDC018338]|uniref:protein kilB n=1 Tax=Streptomyces sp. NPDC018338 TaxID=3157192 RepID=UPI0033D8145F
MLAAVIAVIGTLLGAIVAGFIQQRTARTARDAARVDHRRDRELEAVTNFAFAVAAHRRAMFVREDLRLSGAEADHAVQSRTESHVACSAIESPRVLVSILVPALGSAAAVQASYALRSALDTDTLAELRQSAADAADNFATAAARHFA